MANYFQLFERDSEHPASFQDIDDKMRLFFNQPASATEWLWGWYDIIGLRLACGQSFDQIKEECERLHMDELVKAATWLDYNYRSECWARRGK